MKNKLYLIIVICGISFFFSILLINLKIVNEINKNNPNGTLEKNYVSFFYQKEGSDYLYNLSINTSNILKSIPNIKDISTYSSINTDVGLSKNKNKVEKVALVSSSFFKTLGLKAQIGRTTQQSNGVTLTYNYANKISRSPIELIGKQIWIHGEPAIIDGILAENFTGLGESVSIYLSEEIFHIKLQNSFIDQPVEWQKKLIQADTNQFVFGTIDSIKNLKKIQELANKSLSLYNNELMFMNSDGEKSYFNFSKVRNIKIQQGVILKTNERSALLKIITPMYWIIFLLAVATIINYFYFQLSILPLLQQSLSIKVICGAPIIKIFLEYFYKAFFPLILGLIISIPLEKILFKILLKLELFKDYYFTSSFDYSYILVGVTISIIISIISSFINSYYTFKKSNINMSHKMTGSKIENITRSASIILLLSFGIIVLFNVLLLSKDIKSFSKYDRGYNKDNVYTLYLEPDENSAEYSDLLTTLSDRFNNKIAAYDVLEPLDNPKQTRLEVNGKSYNASLHLVTPNFFNVTNLHISSGKVFTKQSPSGVIISDSIMHKIGFSSNNAIGKLINVELLGMQMPYIIIGVSKTLADSEGDVFLNSFNPESFTMPINKFLIKSNLNTNKLKSFTDDAVNDLNWRTVSLVSLQKEIDLINSNKRNLLFFAQIISLGIMLLIISTVISHVRYDLNIRKTSRNIKLVFGASSFNLLIELLFQYLIIIFSSFLISLLFIFTIKHKISIILKYVTTKEYFILFGYGFFITSLVILILISVLSINESSRDIVI